VTLSQGAYLEYAYTAPLLNGSAIRATFVAYFYPLHAHVKQDINPKKKHILD